MFRLFARVSSNLLFLSRCCQVILLLALFYCPRSKKNVNHDTGIYNRSSVLGAHFIEKNMAGGWAFSQL